MLEGERPLNCKNSMNARTVRWDSKVRSVGPGCFRMICRVDSVSGPG